MSFRRIGVAVLTASIAILPITQVNATATADSVKPQIQYMSARVDASKVEMLRAPKCHFEDDLESDSVRGVTTTYRTYTCVMPSR